MHDVASDDRAPDPEDPTTDRQLALTDFVKQVATLLLPADGEKAAKLEKFREELSKKQITYDSQGQARPRAAAQG